MTREQAKARAREIVSAMTVEEKASQLLMDGFRNGRLGRISLERPGEGSTKG